jgi:dynein heavy chain
MVAYSGPFTSSFRTKMDQEWQRIINDINSEYQQVKSITDDILPRSTKGTISLRAYLGEEVKIQLWNICGLPKDDTSIENGIIIDKARRWPLMIDPQNQASQFIKQLGREQGDKSFETVKINDPSLMKTIEKSISFGMWVLVENVGRDIDPSLDPVLASRTLQGTI